MLKGVHDGKTASEPTDDKLRIVLSVISGEMTTGQAARHGKVSEQSVSRWKQQFLADGKAALGEAHVVENPSSVFGWLPLGMKKEVQPQWKKARISAACVARSERRYMVVVDVDIHGVVDTGDRVRAQRVVKCAHNA